MVARALFLTLLLVLPLQAVQITATVDARSVLVQEPFKLTIEAKGSQGMHVVRLPEMERIAVLSGPMQSSNYSWVNGQMTGSKTLTYTLVALTPGRLVIPALDVRVDRKVHKTAPIEIEVFSRGQASEKQARESKAVFMKAVPNKTDVFLGEPLTVQFKLYTKLSVYNYQIDKLPDAVGFWSEDMEQNKEPRLVSEVYDGERYNTAILKTVVFYPTRSGVLTIDPLKVQLEVEVKSQNRRRGVFNDPFFNDPFSDPFTRRAKQVHASDQLDIKVQDLPQPVPANFSGAVGEFSLSARLDTSTLQVNDAVGLHLTLKGRGNFKTLQVPEPEFPEGLDAFKPERSENIRLNRMEYEGDKSSTYLLVPRQTGDFVIESIPISYFNPRSKRYQSTATPRLELNVIQAGRDDQVIVSGYSREEVEMMGEDIRYIKAVSNDFTRIDRRLGGNGLLWASFSLGGILMAGFAGYEYRMGRLEGNVALRRRNRALRTAQDLLVQAGESGENSNEFTTLISRALTGFIGDRLNLAEHAMETDALIAEVSRKLSDEAGLERLTNLFSRLSMDRFAPDTGAVQRAQLPEEAAEILKILDEVL